MSIGKPVAGVCVSTALFVCGAAGYPQAGTTLPPASGTLTLDSSSAAGAPSNIRAGGSFVITGTGFASNAAVSIVVYSEPRELGYTVADSSGRIDTSVSIPQDLVGRHTLTAVGNGADGSPRSLQAPVSVLGATETAPASLAYTGLSVAGLLAGAIGLIVAGFALVRTAVFGRRLTAAR